MAPPMTLQSLNTSTLRSLPFPNPARIRTYILRLPLFTRIVLFAILVLWLLEFQTMWSVIDWGSLIPDQVGLGSMYRLNTYPLVHMGFFHMFLDTFCLVPLLERFEAKYGTLTSIALFMGPLSTIPGGIYVLLERFVFKNNAVILGSSIWVFLLLASEAVETYKTNPFFDIASVKIPTWVSPLLLVAVTSVLIPNCSFLGHLCACLIGYLWGFGYLKILAPPEKVLRWIESKLNLLGRLPHYVSVDQKTYGRYGVLPQTTAGRPTEHLMPVRMSWLGASGGQRLGS